MSNAAAARWLPPSLPAAAPASASAVAKAWWDDAIQGSLLKEANASGGGAKSSGLESDGESNKTLSESDDEVRLLRILSLVSGKASCLFSLLISNALCLQKRGHGDSAPSHSKNAGGSQNQVTLISWCGLPEMSVSNLLAPSCKRHVNWL